MDRKTLRKLVQRLSMGRVARGEEAAARRRVLDDLYAAGVPTEDAVSLSQDELATMPGHSLLAWARDGDLAVDLYAIADADIDDRMRNALDAVNGLELETPWDCSLYQYGAAMRILAATGLEGDDGEAFYEARIPPVLEEMGGERDLEYLPSLAEIDGLFGRFRASHAGRNAFARNSLDRRFTHVYGVRQSG